VGDIVWIIVTIAAYAFVFSFGENLARKLTGPKAAKSAAAKNPDLEQRLADLERSHDKTREFVISFSTLVTSLLIVAVAAFYFGLQPGTTFSFVVLTGAAYAAANLLTRWLLRD
jgi:hypothetical protein